MNIEIPDNFADNVGDATGNDNAGSIGSEGTAVTESTDTQDPLDLDSVDKFRLDGQDFTPEELRRAILRQKDYSQKTMKLSEERKSFESESKYVDNLSEDLKAVQRDPSLAAKFREIYPDKYHRYLDFVQAKQEEAEQQAGTSQQGQASNEVKELLSRIDRLEKADGERQAEAYSKVVETESKLIDAQIDKLSKQFPYADEDAVLSRIQTLLGEGVKVTDKTWERVYKEKNEQMKKLFDTRSNERVKAQLNKSKNSRDIGRGGGAVQTTKGKQTFDQARERLIRNLGGE